MEYSFGLPGIFVWVFHILAGIFLIYLGNELLNNRQIDSRLAIVLIVVGSLAAAYHSHLLYLDQK